jgi:hypothetical protein
MQELLQTMAATADRLYLPQLPIEGAFLIAVGGFELPAFGAIWDHEKDAISRLAEYTEESGDFAAAAITVIMRSRYDATWTFEQSAMLPSPIGLGLWLFYSAEREGLWQQMQAALS